MKNALKIEPLSDEKWAEIEEGVFAALDREEGLAASGEAKPVSGDATRVNAGESKAPVMLNRFRKQVLVASVSAALAAAAAILWIGGRDAGVHGQTAALATAQPKEVPVAASARPVTQVATQSSPSTVRIEGADLEVAPETGLTVEDDPVKGTSVFLSRGSATFEVAPRTNRPPFYVWAGTTRVRVVGTKFTVTRSERGSAVSVQSGVVEVIDANRTKLLYKGDVWPDSAAGDTANPESPIRDSASAPGMTPRKHARITNGHTELRHAAKLHRGGTTNQTGSPVGSAGALQETQAASGVDEARLTAPRAAEPQVVLTLAGRFEQASALERKEPDRALVLYRAIAREGSGSWNQNALFAAARLQADRGQKEGAIATLEEYLRKYPSGANAEDAKSLLKLLRQP